MSVKLVSMNCPSCGAQIDVPSDRDMCYCAYCGQQIKIDDGSYTVTYKVVDEAEVARAEGDAFAKKKWAGISEDAIRIGIRIIAVAVGISLFTGVIGFIRGDEDPFEMFGLLMGGVLIAALYGAMIFVGSKHTPVDEGNLARIPMSEESFKMIQADDAVEQLRSAGFTDVSSVAVHDLNFLSSGKEGLVKEVTVDGRESISAGQRFDKDAHIVVSYHSR